MSTKLEIPDVVVAAPGYSPIISIAGREVSVNSYEPFDLTISFDRETLEKCSSLRQYLDKKILLPYKKNMELPSNPTSRLTISPRIVEKKQGNTVKTSVKQIGNTLQYNAEISVDIKKNIDAATARGRAKLNQPVNTDEDDIDTPVLPKGQDIKHIGRSEAISFIKGVAKKRAEASSKLSPNV